MNKEILGAAADIAEPNDKLLTRLALEINTIKDQTRQTVYMAMMGIGQRLLQAKGAVGHGNWESWLRENVEYSPRTAQRLIASYERFGDGQQKIFGRNANPEQLAELNKTQIMTLMSIRDEEQCLAFMEDHKEDIKDMSKAELEAVAKELNGTKQELNQAKTKLADNERMLADNERIRKDYQKQLAELQSQLAEVGENKELSELKVRYTFLQQELEEAKERHEKYHGLFEESQEKVTSLSKALEEVRNKPIEAATVEKIVEIEKVPEDVQKKLEAMKARISELEASGQNVETPEEKAFGHHVMNVKSEMEAAVTQLMAISDESRKLKYALLLRKLLKGTLSMTSWAESKTK